MKVYEIMQRMVDADLDKGFAFTAAEIKTLEGREMLVGLLSPPVTDHTCGISYKRASGRFSFHFREVFQKCIEHIGKFLIQMREVLKFC